MIGVVDKFNMVDMDGIDIVESQGVAVDGLFSKLLNAIQNCRYQVLYNWKFAKIEIAPSYVELVFDGTRIYINEAVSVTEDDVVHIYSLEPEPITPVIESLTVTENGVYEAPGGVDGYAPITVNVSSGVVYAPYDPEYEQGAVTGAQATYASNKTSSMTRIRPVDIVDVSQFLNSRVLIVWNEAMYDITVQQYDSSGIARVYGNPWYTTALLATISQPNIVIPIRKKSGANITPSEFESVELKIISITDSDF